MQASLGATPVAGSVIVCVLRSLVFVFVLPFAGCASEPRGPFFNDERYLVFGVQPDREADAVAEQLRAAGFRVASRLAGKHFSAMGFYGSDGQPRGVRVVTGRGIALALDPVEGDVFTEAVRYRLLEAPYVNEHDADGDGFEEVFVERFVGPIPSRCVLSFRVRDSGFVDAVLERVVLPRRPESAEPVWLDPYFCAEDDSTPDAGVDASVDAGPAPGTDAGGPP